MKDNRTNLPLLSVRNLTVKYQSGGKIVNAVNDVSLDIDAGKTLGLVGETGAGKTTIAKAIMRILPDHATKSVTGEVIYKGEDLMKLKNRDMQNIRGRQISMVFQDPMTSLNPTMQVDKQIAEGLALHLGISKKQARQKAKEMLKTVGIGENRSEEYPHQFSGGMKQRVVIALALACRPELLLADEPTTALDVTIQAQVLDLIAELNAELGTAMILITHDLGVVAQTCDNVAVVYAGQIVEYGSKEDIFESPCHPYTKGLFAALPDLHKDVSRLSPIDGMPPDPTNLPVGCAFNPRCKYATEACKCKPIDMFEVSAGHTCRCLMMKGEDA